MSVVLRKGDLSTELLRALAKIVSLTSPQLLLFFLKAEPHLRGGVVETLTKVGVFTGFMHFIVALRIHALVRRGGILLAQTRVLGDPYLDQWLNHIKVVLILLLVPNRRSDFIFELVELFGVLLRVCFVPSISFSGEVEVLVVGTLGKSMTWLGGTWGRWLGEFDKLI